MSDEEEKNNVRGDNRSIGGVFCDNQPQERFFPDTESEDGKKVC